MNIKFLFSSMLMDTPFVQDVSRLTYAIGEYVSDTEHMDKLADWTMVLCVNFTSIQNHGPFIWIFNRSRTYRHDKEKEFTLHIPLPSEEHCSWGIGSKQIIPQKPFDEKYFYKVSIELDKYSSLYDYVNESILRGIRELFKHGFTFQGIRVKYTPTQG